MVQFLRALRYRGASCDRYAVDPSNVGFLPSKTMNGVTDVANGRCDKLGNNSLRPPVFAIKMLSLEISNLYATG